MRRRLFAAKYLNTMSRMLRAIHEYYMEERELRVIDKHCPKCGGDKVSGLGVSDRVRVLLARSFLGRSVENLHDAIDEFRQRGDRRG
jgi:hypothetical protein